jgi:REP-associated tyrosine transposase
VRNEEDDTRRIEYRYINPVRHGLVPRVADWPYSSLHRDMRAGLFPPDWAGDIAVTGAFGERAEY